MPSSSLFFGGFFSKKIEIQHIRKDAGWGQCCVQARKWGGGGTATLFMSLLLGTPTCAEAGGMAEAQPSSKKWVPIASFCKEGTWIASNLTEQAQGCTLQGNVGNLVIVQQEQEVLRHRAKEPQM